MAIISVIITFLLDGIDLVGQQELKWPLVVLEKIAAARTRRDGWVPRTLQRMMELSMVQSASTGLVAVVTGWRIYVFVTVASFMCMSLDHPQHAGYVTVETEEVCCIFNNKPARYGLCGRRKQRVPFLSPTPSPFSLLSRFLRLSRRLEKYINHFLFLTKNLC